MNLSNLIKSSGKYVKLTEFYKFHILTIGDKYNKNNLILKNYNYEK